MDYKLYLGDCLEIMKSIPDKSIDAVITDPPYNVGLSYNTHDDSMSNYLSWCSNWYTELNRVSDCIFISCGIVNLETWAKIAKPKWVLAWLKEGAMGRSPFGFCNWEPILFYGKSQTNKKTDVFKAPIIVRDDTGNHPCPKPIKWASGLISYTNDKSTILDPFMGSGTTGVACIQTGRNFIGCEIDPGYFKIAEKRIHDAQQQMRLF